MRIRPRPRPSAAGDETVVLCATRGEAGESRIRTDDLAALREAELHEAARILGVGNGAPARPRRLRDGAASPAAGTLAAADRRAVVAARCGP